ncbi:hypothetical protein BDZ91DRAFT_761318 [Kalaharituber pfeilii]|nr:hypothetical protein BDZ91DRAFT_761318 [Kalaharituber pfeilii]
MKHPNPETKEIRSGEKEGEKEKSEGWESESPGALGTTVKIMDGGWMQECAGLFGMKHEKQQEKVKELKTIQKERGALSDRVRLGDVRKLRANPSSGQDSPVSVTRAADEAFEVFSKLYLSPGPLMKDLHPYFRYLQRAIAPN